MKVLKIESETKFYVLCPNCNFRMESVTHLLGHSRISRHNTQCYKCQRIWKLEVQNDNVHLVDEVLTSQVYMPAIALMASKTTPVLYWVIPVRSYAPDDVKQNMFHYNESTCPINWINDSVITIQNKKPMLSLLKNVVVDCGLGQADNHDMYHIVDIRSAEWFYNMHNIEYDIAEKDHGVDWCRFEDEQILKDLFPQVFE